jgi:hypothetical protein
VLLNEGKEKLLPTSSVKPLVQKKQRKVDVINPQVGTGTELHWEQ